MQFESAVLPGAGNVTVLTLNGRLDVEGTQEIEQKFAFATTVKAANLVVDLSGVSFLASIGIRLLITSARGQSSRGGKLVLAAPQPLVHKVIETAGIDQLITVFADVEAARASFGG